ncbi:hypothetical protein MBRU_12005 [Mycolicibacterium brumae DSM 44177]|nr:hypothetical protein MBRU_12005 [Mycolicibacterium brumae DSM 44177]
MLGFVQMLPSHGTQVPSPLGFGIIGAVGLGVADGVAGT